MKSIKKRILSVFTAAALAVGSLCLPDIGVLPSLVVPASAEVSCSYDSTTKTLTISGTGTINRADIIGYANHATTISIGADITAIGGHAFTCFEKISSITIPDNVTSIGTNAFYSCRLLKSATIGNGVTSIGSYAFYDCESLSSITIPSSVASIGTHAFGGCSSLSSITIPSSVTSIGEGAFGGCSHLATVNYGGSAAQWATLTANSGLPTNVTITYGQTLNISDCTIDDISDQTYTGTPIEPDPVVKYGDTTLTKGTHYTVSYSPASPTNVGTVTVTVTAKTGGGFTGSKTTTFNITKAKPATPAAPTLASKTTTSITLTAVDGCEYKRDNGEWQDSPTFTELTAATSYTFYQRVKGDSNHKASDPSAGASLKTTIPALSFTVTFKVVNGEWNGGGSADKTVTLSRRVDEDLLLKLGAGDIPAVGSKPADGYKASGAWDTVPNTETVISADKTYTYTYAEKAAPTITTAPTASAISYGQTLANSTLSGGAASVGGTFAWKTPATAPTVADSNTTQYDVIFTPTDTANYKTATCTVKLTVNKAEPTITTVPTASAISYGQTLANSTLSGGAASVAGTFAWKTTATAPTVADSNTTQYDVIFTPTDTANYKTATCTVKLTVNKADKAAPTGIAATPETVSGKSDGTITGVDNTMEYRKDGTAAYTAITGTTITGLSVGKYYVHYKESANYNASPDISVEIAAGVAMTEVARVEPTCTAKGRKAHYKGSDNNLYSKNGDTYTLIADPTTLDIPALGHNIKSVAAVPATCTASGTKAHYMCERCNMVFTDAKGKNETTLIALLTDALGHDYKDGKCTRCGLTEQTNYTNTSSAAPAVNWSDFLGKIAAIPDGGSLTIDMKGTTTLPKDILGAIKGKDVNITLDMGSGIKWSINGKSVTKISGNVNMGVGIGKGSISADVLNKLSGERYNVTMRLMHNGEFGFTAVLSVALRKQDAGLFANLFYSNKTTKLLEYVASALIGEDGTAGFEFTHASDYAIVVDDHPLDEGRVTANVDGSSVKLTWDAVPGAASYTVYNAKNGKWVKLTTMAKNELTVYKLKNNKTYKFRVKAKVNGKLTEAYNVTVKLCYKPVLKATAKDGAVTLKWSEVNNAAKYRVMKYTGGEWKKVKTTTDTSLYIDSAKSGKKYKYAVQAYVGGKWTEIGTTSTATVKVK